MTSQPYRPALLSPSRVEGAEALNAPLLGPESLGVEVTEAGLASRCGLGVIDPQHGFGGGEGSAAIEAALDWPLPPAGATLVTIRPDADAFGAMAVLSMRAKGMQLGDAALERVRLVARCDSFAAGDWSDWLAERGPLAKPAFPDEVSMFPLAYAEAAALAQARELSPAQRVAAFELWLTDGVAPKACRERAMRFAADLASAFNNGRVTIERMSGLPVARVEGAQPGALILGYRWAPVVIGYAGSDSPRTVTIAQFARHHVDLASVARALSRLEEGWGGSATIIGSPQGIGSRLPASTIEAIVQGHLAPSLISCDAKDYED